MAINKGVAYISDRKLIRTFKKVQTIFSLSLSRGDFELASRCSSALELLIDEANERGLLHKIIK